MNVLIEISAHPKLEGISRKVELQNLTIDYKSENAYWGWQIIHFDSEGKEMIEIAKQTGQFRLSNDRFVNPQTGIKLTAEELVDEEIERVGEFTFLRNLLLLPNVDPYTLGFQRVLISDARGNFNDYTKLMNL